MAERDLIEVLNQALDAMLSSAGPTPSVEDTPAGELVQVAGALRDLPGNDFRERLKSELAEAARTSTLKRREAMTAAPVTFVPKGFRSVTPYMHPAGAAKFIDFLKQAFDAEEVFRYNTGDGRVMHAEIRIGDSMLEMGDTDPVPTALHYYVPDADEVYRRALAAGGESLYAPTDQPYGDRESGVKDPFGNFWFIATRKGASHVPPGLHSITPFLLPKGVPEVIDFLKRAFGGEELERHASPEGTVLHAMVRIGDSIIEMGEAQGQWQPMPAVLHLYVPDTDATYRSAVGAGAVSLSEPEDKPYGDRAAGVRDPSGNIWYIATHIRDVAVP